MGEGRRYCAWHAAQADEGSDQLPALHNGALTIEKLIVWAVEFDAIDPDDNWTAVAFLDWIAGSLHDPVVGA